MLEIFSTRIEGHGMKAADARSTNIELQNRREADLLRLLKTSEN